MKTNEPEAIKEVSQQSGEGRRKLPARRKRMIAAVTAAAVIVVGAGAVIYSMVVDTPEKLLADSLYNTFSLKKVTYEATLDNPAADPLKAESRKLTATGRYASDVGHGATLTTTLPLSGYDLSIVAEAVLVNDGDAYVNYKDITYMPVSGGALPGHIDDAMQASTKSMLTNKWLKTEAEELRVGSSCELGAFQKLQKEPSLARDLVGAVQRAGGMRIGTKDATDSEVTLTAMPKPEKAADALAAYKETSFYKDILACSGSEETALQGVSDVILKGSFELRIDKKARLIKELRLTHGEEGGKATLRVAIKPASDVTVDIPKGAVSSLAPVAPVPSN